VSDPKNISENGAPILTGKGLEAVKKIMQQRFAAAMQTGPTSMVVPPKDAAKTLERSCLTARPIRIATPRPELSLLAQPYLRAAEKRFADTPVRHPHTQHCHVIIEQSIPDISTLYADAVAVIERTTPKVPTKSDRHVMQDDEIR
jgi:hypothetical protein